MEARGINPAIRFGILAALVVAFIFAFGALIGGCSSLNRPGPTQVALIRNGGPLDSKDIREVRAPGSSYAISGLFSEPRMYIAGNEQRYYKVSSDPSLGQESGSDFIKMPTKDGVNVEVDAQISFRTAFTNEGGDLTPCNCPNDKGEEEYEWLIEKFDTDYGNRNFRAKDGDQEKVWDGNDGWNAFLDSIFRPVVENAFREQVGSVNCADLVSSCALVQSSTQEQSIAFTGADNRENFERIQNAVQTQIDEGVESALGREYLTGFKVQLTKVTLPQRVQDAIDDAQASFAKIAEARAGKIQADYQAQANERLASAYRDNPVLGYLKAIEVLKDSTATIIVGEPGTGLNLGR